MRRFIPRLTFRNPGPRVWLGLALIGVSIAGVVLTVATAREGVTIILANAYIPAGSIITESDVTTARLVAPNGDVGDSPRAVVGLRAAEDIAMGDVISRHHLDGSLSTRRILSVPLDFPPAKLIAPGDRVQIWFSPSNASSPPVLVARDAILIAVRASGFGDGDVIEISTVARDEIPLIEAMGSDGTLVAVKGGSPT